MTKHWYVVWPVILDEIEKLEREVSPWSYST